MLTKRASPGLPVLPMMERRPHTTTVARAQVRVLLGSFPRLFAFKPVLFFVFFLSSLFFFAVRPAGPYGVMLVWPMLDNKSMEPARKPYSRLCTLWSVSFALFVPLSLPSSSRHPKVMGRLACALGDTWTLPSRMPTLGFFVVWIRRLLPRLTPQLRR